MSFVHVAVDRFFRQASYSAHIVECIETYGVLENIKQEHEPVTPDKLNRFEPLLRRVIHAMPLLSLIGSLNDAVCPEINGE